VVSFMAKADHGLCSTLHCRGMHSFRGPSASSQGGSWALYRHFSGMVDDHERGKVCAKVLPNAHDML